MFRCPPLLLLLFLLGLGHPAALAVPPFQPEGFGASSKGGTGGRLLLVTRLDDHPDKPVKGTLRWALRQKGPRVVKFAVSGTIQLKQHLEVKQPFLTIDGSDAPGAGICIRGGSLEFQQTHDIIVRHVRIRLGDENTLRQVKAAGLKRPKNSDGLDCIGMKDSRRILIEHCSLSWSCDELFGITRCRDVTIQWCILGEPLTNPQIHPYGDNHAFVLNCSASTLSLHHCLLARFVMRGPQFECNDLTARDDYTVRMEAVNNIIFDYQRSGSRYSTGVEPGNGTGAGKSFRFQFLGNLYMTSNPRALAIEPIGKYGLEIDVKVGMRGNKLILRPDKKPSPGAPRPPLLGHKGNVLQAFPRTVQTGPGYWTAALVAALPYPTPRGETAVAPEVSATRLFQAPVPVTEEPVEDAARRILTHAGCRTFTDEVDARLISDVMLLRFRKPVKSQRDVGGWPALPSSDVAHQDTPPLRVR